jgi:hypothetical protein
VDGSIAKRRALRIDAGDLQVSPEDILDRALSQRAFGRH